MDKPPVRNLLVNRENESTSACLSVMRRGFVSVACCIVVLVSAATCFGQQTFKLKVSRGFAASDAGFQFRRAQLDTANGLPVKKDITVWCHISTTNWRGQIWTKDHIPIVLEAGQTSTERDLYLPATAVELMFSQSRSPNASGRRLLSLPINDRLNAAGEIDDILVASDKLAKYNEVEFSRRARVSTGRLREATFDSIHYTTSGTTTGELRLSHANLRNLPKRWIGYSSRQHVYIDHKQLAKLALDTERFDALVQWVSMGGALVVFDCGKDFGRVREVTRLLKINETAGIPNGEFYTPTDKLQIEQDAFETKLAIIAPASQIAAVQPPSNRSRLVEPFQALWQEASAKRSESNSFEIHANSDVVLYPLVAGRILFHSDPLNAMSDTQHLSTEFASMSAAKQTSNVFGASNSIGSAFQNWHLLNVGAAPIALFTVVLLGFMTLIGPLGYFYLKVKQKLHYQIWAVPLISCAACLMLLGYAFIAEGIGTKVRATTYVKLDQGRKMAAVYNRHSIYAALSPKPYEFSDNQFATLESFGVYSQASCRWSDHQYQLSGGGAVARNVHQVFVANPQKMESGVEVKKNEEPNVLVVTNRFEDEAKVIVLKSGGEIYFAINLKAGQQEIVQPISAGKLTETTGLREAFVGLIAINQDDYSPATPGWYYGRRSIDSWDLGVGEATNMASIYKLREFLEDGNYIAIFDSLSEVEPVAVGARSIDGRVFVHGKW